MTQRSFELPESLSHHLLPADFISLREAYELGDHQKFTDIADRYFSTWTTSLMGSDLQTFKDLSLQETLRVHLNSIRIEDDWERNDPEPIRPAWAEPMITGPEAPPPESAVHIWPRDNNRVVQSDRIGAGEISDILKELKLRPDTITVRDYHVGNVTCNLEPCAALARSILEGADIAITSFGFHRDSEVFGALEMRFTLSPEHQGRGVGISMLRSADLMLSRDLGSYWLDQVSQAPNLSELKIRCIESWHGANLALMARLSTPTLTSLAITTTDISSQVLFDLIANCRETLTSLSLHTIKLTDNASWCPLLSQIAQDCTALTSFNIRLLSVEADIARSTKFRVSKEDLPKQNQAGLKLTEKGPAHQRRVNGVRYSGPNVAEVLKIIAASAVNWGYVNANYEILEV